MRTARAIFQKSAAFAAYQKLIADPAFELACHAALSAFIETLPVQFPDPSKSWDAACQIAGARRVLDLLNSLHEPDEPAKSAPWPTLNYKALETPK
jgi:hypothetical protein